MLILMLSLATLASCMKPSKNEYILRGSIDTALNEWVFLQHRGEGPMEKIDSVKADMGKFVFKGTVDFPEVFYVSVPATRSMVMMFIEPGELTMDINTRNIDLTQFSGSPSQAAYDQYLDQLDQFNNHLREYYNFYQKAMEIGDAAKARQFDSLLMAEEGKRSAFIKDYVLANPASVITPYIAFQNSFDYDLESLDKALSAFDPSLKASKYTGYLQKYLDIMKRTAPGQHYLPFSMADTAGIAIELSSFIGEKYLLVDFWASWCSPCREENPNLVALYQEYNPKGFDILGVSFDTKRDRWMKAIVADKLTWHHVSDLKGWENAAGKIYGIRAIPSNILLDTAGIIIGKNLRGDDLRKKLEEIFPASI